MRFLRRIFVASAALLALLLGAAWVVPPRMDWSRQRPAMEALASAALGRKVRIEGAIGLRLLPEPMLTARGVRVLGGEDAERLRIGALRLGVALGSLLRGRMVARELVLAGAEWRLPWPPEGDGLGLPNWQVGFSGRVEDGRISMGPWQFSDIQLSLSGAEDGALRLDGRLAVAGVANARPWQVAARIGEPGLGGRTWVEANLSGRDQLNGVVAALTGTLGGADGIVGRLSLRGPDLSRLMPATAGAFRAEGKLRTAASELVWDDVNLEVAGAVGRATVALAYAAEPVVRVAVEAGRLDVEPWLAALWRARAGGMPLDLRLKAEAAGLAGGTLRQLSLRLKAENGALRLAEGAAILPGEAELRGSGVVRADGDAPAFDGDIELRAADPRTGLRWMAEAFGVAMPALPAGALRRVAGTAHLTWAPGGFSLTRLAGQIDDSKIGGDVGYQAREPPVLRASLEVDRLVLDPWVPVAMPGPGEWLTGLNGRAADIQLRVGSLGLGGRVTEGVLMDVLAEPKRLVLRQLHGALHSEGDEAVRFAASGQVLPGGQIAEARLDVTAAMARAVLPWVPEAWRGRADLWDGPLTLHAEAAGPLEALAVQANGQLDDGRGETQLVLDLPARRIAGRLVLRHPSAARLLTEMGWPRANSEPGDPVWPGEGSLFLSARFTADPGGMVVESADVTAGALRARGKGKLRLAEAGVAVSGDIDAERLPLPWPRDNQDASIPVDLLRGWEGHVTLRAEQVLLDEAPVVEGLGCQVAPEGAAVRVSGCTARWQGGGLAFQGVLDGGADPPAFSLQAEAKGMRLVGLPAAWSGTSDDAGNEATSFEAPPGVQVRAEQADLSVRLGARGHSIAAMRATLAGNVDIEARDVTVVGFDLPGARVALERARGGSAETLAAALRDALAAGRSEFGDGELAAEIQGDVLILRRLAAKGAAGEVTGTGSVALRDGTLDLRLDLRPLAPEGRSWPYVGLALNGRPAAPRRVGDIAPALHWLAAPAASTP